VTYREIYDFGVGDVFQYYESSCIYDFIYTIDEEVKKFAITEKHVINDSLIYSIRGIRHHIRKEVYSNSDNSEHILSDDIDSLNTNLIYIDSASHYLNQPDSTLFPLFYVFDKQYYVFVKEIADTIVSKQIGGDLNEATLFTYNDDSILTEDWFYPQYHEIYGMNLGLVYYLKWDVEYTEETILQGYIKDGVTTGIVFHDSYFTAVTEDHENTLINLYPNPVTDILQINGMKNGYSGMSITFYSPDGRPVLTRKIESEEISVQDLPRGLYFYQIGNQNGLIFRGTIVKG